MYLLRRKSDGKFWRNRSDRYKHWVKGAEEREWVGDPSQCRPFTTKSGAMNSRGTRAIHWEHNVDTLETWSKKLAAHRKNLEVVPALVKVTMRTE